MAIHDGHRERMKKRFIESGLDGFDNLNALEMLLFYALPRKNTNEIAHDLIGRFGSLSDVLSADIEELMTVDGIGENAAILINLVTQMNKRYLEERSLKKQVIANCEDAGKYFVAKFAYETNEKVYALLLNSSNAIICCKEIGSGVVNGAEISIRELMELGIKYKAVSVILSHNHPGGTLQPSLEDELCTAKIKSALNLVGIKLIDHIIVSDSIFLSLSDLDLI